MSVVTLYSFEDENGQEQTYTTFNPREAEEYARQWNMLCIANEYEFSDSEFAWDYRPEQVSEDD